MQGSCKPAAEGEVWSLYDPKKEIPQAITGWVPTGPAAQAPVLTCSKDLNLGHQLANCFSFACNDERYVNGVPVAIMLLSDRRGAGRNRGRAAHDLCDASRAGRRRILRRAPGWRPGLRPVTAHPGRVASPCDHTDPSRRRSEKARAATASQFWIAWVTAPPVAVRPPSTTYCAPVIAAARSEHKNNTVLAISSVVT